MMLSPADAQKARKQSDSESAKHRKWADARRKELDLGVFIGIFCCG